MPQALPLTNLLAPSIQKSMTTRSLKAQFGDGFQQRAKNGINADTDRWVIEYIWMNDTDATTVNDALKAVGTFDYFTWTPYKESTSKKFYVDDGSIKWSYNKSMTKISFTMTQTY